MVNTVDLKSKNRGRAFPLQPSDPGVEFLCWVPRTHQDLPIPSESSRENDKVNAKPEWGLFGFFMSPSAAQLYNGRVPRLTSDNFTCCPPHTHMRQSEDTMTSVSAGHTRPRYSLVVDEDFKKPTKQTAGHIMLTPTQPVGSGRSQRESNPRLLTGSLSVGRTALGGKRFKALKRILNELNIRTYYKPRSLALIVSKMFSHFIKNKTKTKRLCIIFLCSIESLRFGLFCLKDTSCIGTCG